MTPRHDLTTVPVSLATLRPHPRNPRNGDTDRIARSLDVNGQFVPIVVARDGTVLVGNHRYAAAMELGWDTIHVIRLDLDPESEEAVRIMLADNATSDHARNDDALLLDLLREMPTLDGTGMDDDDMLKLLRMADAELAFGSQQVLDEFLDSTGTSGDRVAVKYHSMLKVYFEDEAAVTAFQEAIGYGFDKGQLMLRYPQSFQRRDIPDWPSS